MKFQMSALSLASAVLFASTGCTPLPIVDRAESTTADFPFGDIGTFDKVKAKFKDYYVLYTTKAQDDRVIAQYASETGFYGAVIGVLGGIAKDITAVASGAGIGAGAGLFSDRYRLQVQAANYEAAADAMLCMYRASIDISDAKMEKLVVEDQPATSVIRDVAVDGFIAVRSKLYNLQANFALGQPDPNKLKDALTAPPKDAAPKKNPGGTGFVALDANETTVQELLKGYKNNIDQCLAKISA